MAWRLTPSQQRNLRQNYNHIHAYYYPAGYEALTLASPIPLPGTKVGIKRALERFEHAQGNTYFTVSGIGPAKTPLVKELANVYLGLRSRYTDIYPQTLSFATEHAPLDPSLAWAVSPLHHYPALFNVARELNEPSAATLAARLRARDAEILSIPAVARQRALAMFRLYAPALRGKNLLSGGEIYVSECLSHPECYTELYRLWAYKDEYHKRHNQPVAAKTNVSPAAEAFVHEFGHLVEWRIHELGDDAVRYVYKALTKALLYKNKRPLISTSDLAAHGLTRKQADLYYYPKPANLREATTTTKAMRELAGPHIVKNLNRYAKSDRTELFAEAFALSYVAKDQELKQRLAGLRRAIYDVGIGSTRRTTAQFSYLQNA